MKIIHVDVDAALDVYLDGTTYDMSLEGYLKENSGEGIEGLTIKTGCSADKNTLSRFPDLKLLITRTVGIDHIDLEYCKQKGIAVYRIVDYGAFNIAEHTFALMLAGTRHLLDSWSEVQQGRFTYQGHLGFALRDKTIGVIGTGRIGREVIHIAHGFNMKIIAHDQEHHHESIKKYGYRYVEMDELLAQSDVITLHAPLTDETRHMIDDAAIMKMKQGVVLINTARGGLVDTVALIKHIERFRFVGLDVIEGEDTFSAEHPLLKQENVLITPHMAFYSDASVKKIAEETERLIKLYESGSTEERVV
ncbi:MAG: 2-hydroxyacid dehydrogenase [Weeksellaceae bacterium]